MESMRNKSERIKERHEVPSNVTSTTLNTSARGRDKRAKGSLNSSRASRTRTLIQLGGLLDKAGLATAFDIALGDDLQRDDHTFDPAATLLGALLELNTQLSKDNNMDHQKRLWRLKGKKALME
jgi:hypothetical protein